MLKNLSDTFYGNSGKDLISLFALYAISFFLMLTNTGIFWDDWTLYNMPSAIILDTFKQAGSLSGYFHTFLLSMGHSVLAYRVLVFTIYFLCAIFLYFILSGIDEVDRFDRFLIVTLFAVLPVNNARIALINAPAALCHFMFWLGFLLLSRYLKSGRISFRFLALIFFFASFHIASMLVFYLTALLYIIYFEFRKRTSPASLIRKFFSYSDFVILPVAFWVLKMKFLKPYGMYAGYNQILPQPLSREKVYAYAGNLLDLMISSVSSSFLEPLKHSFTENSYIELILLGILIFLVLFKKRLLQTTDQKHIFFYLGWFLFFLAVFPYCAVGKLPRLDDWSSRYQLIIPLGVSLILVYGTKLLIPSERIQKYFYSLFIASFLVTNVSHYVDFQKDWYKQASLLENFKHSEVLKANTSFSFNDKMKEFNANERIYRFYEYTGLMKLAFGDEKRGVDLGVPIKPDTFAYCNMKDFVMIKAQYAVDIHAGKIIGKRDLIKMKYFELFNKEEYIKNIRGLSVLKYYKTAN